MQAGVEVARKYIFSLLYSISARCKREIAYYFIHDSVTLVLSVNTVADPPEEINVKKRLLHFVDLGVS